MTDPLAKIQAIHDESVRLGLGKVLPEKIGLNERDGERFPVAPGGRCAVRLALAAWSWWLMDWCHRKDTHGALHTRHDTAYYIAWAEEILAEHVREATKKEGA